MPAGEGRRGELRRGRGKARSVPAKYRNPKNADEVWSGRGRMPLWLGAAIKAGKDRDDFLIAESQPRENAGSRPLLGGCAAF
jgi:DNA-binding protein H-NS